MNKKNTSRNKAHGAGGEIRIAIDSELRNVRLAGMAVRGICSASDLPDRDVFRLELCVVEAVTNCIQHAYSLEPGHTVDVAIRIAPDRLIFIVCDTGKGMPPERIEPATAPPPEKAGIGRLRDGGRGLEIIRKIMDSVSYMTRDGKNYLRMTYFLPRSPVDGRKKHVAK